MGTDWLHPSVMRVLVEQPTQLLFIIYHQSWLTGVVPEEWKLSSVTSTQKGQKEDPGTYRPDSKISLTLMPGYGVDHLECYHTGHTGHSGDQVHPAGI